jgi:predicted LPLAT superfamily acyltransferase
MSAGLRPDSTGPIAPSDLIVAATLPLLALVARTVPEERWPDVVRRLSTLKPQSEARLRPRLATIERSLGIDPVAARRVLHGFRAAQLEERLQLLKDRSRAGWRPALVLDGEERIARELASGRGVLLWVVNAVFASLVVKKTLHGRGFAIHHLSRPTHGWSTTRFGVRRLNPIRTRVEDRYLAERVVISNAATVPAMRRLMTALEGGQVVSITVGDWARRSAIVPFLGGRLRLAAGPAALAARVGAPLLPVFFTREGGGFRVSIGEPVAVETGAGHDATGGLEAYALRLEEWVRAHPEWWSGWDSIE